MQFLYQDDLMQDVGKKIIIIVNNFYDQAKLQLENEMMPEWQKRLNSKLYIAERLDSIHPRYTDFEIAYVKRKRLQMGIDEV